MRNGTTPECSDEYSIYNPYEKLVNVYMLCMEIVQVSSLYKSLRNEIENRNQHEITVILSRLMFDYIIINWAKVCGGKGETLHICKVFPNAGYPIDVVRSDFLTAMGLSKEQYEVMHTHLLDWRDKLLAHFDFGKAFALTHNASFFDNIQPQCRSIAQSVIKAFDKAYLDNPDFKCSLCGDNRIFKLNEIADILRQKLRDYPIDCSLSKWREILQDLVREE